MKATRQLRQLARRGPAAVALPAALLAALAAGTGCKKHGVEILDEQAQSGEDHQLADVLAAARKMGETPASPEAFRALSLELDRLRGDFNADVASIAERHLVLAALGPLEALRTRTHEEQMAALALTVYPSVFGVEPHPGETAEAYVTRLCGAELPLECKQYVPEGWPVVLAAKVWRRLTGRAEDSVGNCRECDTDPTYDDAVRRYREGAQAEGAALAVRDDEIRPGFWPVAGDASTPWSGPPLLELGSQSGDARLAGQVLPPGGWRAAMAAARAGGAVLGVHLPPTMPVGTLRAIVQDAAAAGYREVAVQVRGRGFPYPLGEYRLATAFAARRAAVDVRDVDTMQILVRTLDNAAASGHVGPAHLPRDR